ncbi:THAP protein [Homalodisca vitripennis]|nr:THAP protein [Homalodisca vitripennis]
MSKRHRSKSPVSENTLISNLVANGVDVISDDDLKHRIEIERPSERGSEAMRTAAMRTRGVGGTSCLPIMPQSCVAYGCNNRGKIESFPADEELRRQWVNAVKREKWTPSKHSRLCSVHFREEDLDRTLLRVKELVETNAGNALALSKSLIFSLNRRNDEIGDINTSIPGWRRGNYTFEIPVTEEEAVADGIEEEFLLSIFYLTTDVTCDTVEYVAGFVVRQIQKNIACESCLGLLIKERSKCTV